MWLLRLSYPHVYLQLVFPFIVYVTDVGEEEHAYAAEDAWEVLITTEFAEKLRNNFVEWNGPLKVTCVTKL